MDLDDQLAALAAGELDAQEARALTARVGSDPVLQRRLARIQRLDQVLTSWEAPPLSNDATARIDATITDALEALPDGPLMSGELAATPAPLRALRDEDDDHASAAAASAPAEEGEAVDLAEARARRSRGGTPRWVAGLGVAAAALAVVGTAGQLFSSADRSSDETMAAESTADGEMSDESMPESLGAAAGPLTLAGVEYTEETLVMLAELVPFPGPASDAAASGMDGSEPMQDSMTAELDASGTSAAGAASTDELRMRVAGCLPDALATGLGTPALLAEGSYDAQPALFVVLEGADEEQGTTLTTFVYAPADCSLLATRTLNHTP